MCKVGGERKDVLATYGLPKIILLFHIIIFARFLVGSMFERNLRRILSAHYLKARSGEFSKLKCIRIQES